MLARLSNFMNPVQLALVGLMSIPILGGILFPQWTLHWTEQVEYDYCYENDARAADGSAAQPPALHGRELLHRATVRRALLFPRPRPPAPDLPPVRREQVGTGSVPLGRRITTYTGALSTDFDARANLRKMLRDTAVLGGSTLILVIMFRTGGGHPELFPRARPQSRSVGRIGALQRRRDLSSPGAGGSSSGLERKPPS